MVSTGLQDMDKIRGEIIAAVDGPMLPGLRQRGLDVEFLRLASLQMVRWLPSSELKDLGLGLSGFKVSLGEGGKPEKPVSGSLICS